MISPHLAYAKEFISDESLQDAKRCILAKFSDKSHDQFKEFLDGFIFSLFLLQAAGFDNTPFLPLLIAIEERIEELKND